MEKTKSLILSLALIASNICLAQDYVCKEIYETKTKKMRENRNIRVATKIGATVVLTGGLIMSDSWLLAVGSAMAVGTGGGAMIGGLSLMTYGLGGPLPYVTIDAFDREKGIIEAMQAQQLMNITYEELHEKVREALITQFNKEISDPRKLKEYVRQLNLSRLEQDLPLMNEADSINFIKEKISRSAKVSNTISESLDFAKSRQLIASSYGYEDWRQTMKKYQDIFCTNEKAQTLRRVTKELARLAP